MNKRDLIEINGNFYRYADSLEDKENNKVVYLIEALFVEEENREAFEKHGAKIFIEFWSKNKIFFVSKEHFNKIGHTGADTVYFKNTIPMYVWYAIYEKNLQS